MGSGRCPAGTRSCRNQSAPSPQRPGPWGGEARETHTHRCTQVQTSAVRQGRCAHVRAASFMFLPPRHYPHCPGKGTRLTGVERGGCPGLGPGGASSGRHAVLCTLCRSPAQDGQSGGGTQVCWPLRQAACCHRSPLPALPHPPAPVPLASTLSSGLAPKLPRTLSCRPLTASGQAAGPVHPGPEQVGWGQARREARRASKGRDPPTCAMPRLQGSLMSPPGLISPRPRAAARGLVRGSRETGRMGPVPLLPALLAASIPSPEEGPPLQALLHTASGLHPRQLPAPSFLPVPGLR